MTVPYLSQDHLDAATAAMASDDGLSSAAGKVTVSVNYLITEGPDGDFEYHIKVGDGAVTMSRGSLGESDVHITASYDTAAKLGRGETSSQMAFMTGKVKVKGSIGALMKNMALFQKIESHTYSIDVTY